MGGGKWYEEERGLRGSHDYHTNAMIKLSLR